MLLPACSPTPKSPSSAECKLPHHTHSTMQWLNLFFFAYIHKWLPDWILGTCTALASKSMQNHAKEVGWNHHHFLENYRYYCKVTDSFIYQPLTSKANLLSQTHHTKRNLPEKNPEHSGPQRENVPSHAMSQEAFHPRVTGNLACFQ